jgi:hypothetical protein
MTQRPDHDLAVFARTTFRGQSRPFGIRLPDRRSHMYVIGKTGTGKSTLFETLIQHDIRAGRGVAVLDPHGDLIERLLAWLPKERAADLIHFDVSDSSQPLGFNPLSGVLPGKRALAASGLLEAFKKIWADSWGPRLEHILRNALLCLLDQPEATLADVLRLFDDRTFRRHAAERTANLQVRRFWLQEFEGYSAYFRAEAIAPIQNKVGAFLANPLLYRILTQPRSAFDLRRVMDDSRILFVSLPKGKIGEDVTALLGALLVSQVGFAAICRADAPEKDRKDFFVYLDEFQNFTTLALANMLSELRKYRVGLVLAHQYLAQLDDEVMDAVLGNVGTTIAFRVGATDAELLEGEFAPEFKALDLVNLPNYHIYLKLMVSGVVSRPFSAETLPTSSVHNGS